MKIPGYFKRLCFGAFAATVIAFAGCTRVEEDMFQSGTRPSDCLAFSAAIDRRNTAVTRSSVSCLEIAEEDWELQTMAGSRNVTRAPIANHLDGYAGVIGFQYDNPDGSDRTPIAEGDNNIEFEFSGDLLTSTGTTILWKTITKANLNIYAYAPKVTEGLTVTSTTAPPALDYTVPDTITRQTDLLVARWKSTEQADPNNYKNQTINLAFDHALTAICFKVGFSCTVKSVAINNVYNKGTYNLGEGTWTADESSRASYNFTLDEAGVAFDSGDEIIDRDDCFILMPQTVPAGAEIVLTYVDEETSEEKTYTAPIGDRVWESGKLITYTLHKDKAPATIYFDLAMGNVSITADKDGVGTYSGKVFKNGAETIVSGEHKEGNHYYVYQSTEDNRNEIWEGDNCIPPTYSEVKAPNDQNQPWRDFITNNNNVESVIDAWRLNSDEVATKVGRKGTNNRIEVIGKVTCNLTIDNIYSTYQEHDASDRGNGPARLTAGIVFVPTRYDSSITDAKLTINTLGDNRVGAVHYSNGSNNGNEIIFEGTGSLTVADVDGYTASDAGTTGYYSNHWASAIGGNDGYGLPGHAAEEVVYGIVINSGTIFAGTTQAENCTAIGGGGNVHGGVTINGGSVTAVASTTGTAIGGGIGFNGSGGTGDVTITGGNVYAYNLANTWKCPSSAIGGAGSINSEGAAGTVVIEGGYVYAYSRYGTAIGGGSSFSKKGGNANITITDGEVFAQTGAKDSAGIGGGTACSGQANAFNGGSATITIRGNPIIRTGSVGGGSKGIGQGYIGNAQIQIYGGDIQAQFLLSAGTAEGEIPTFEMTGGTIRNSNTDNTEDTEYYNAEPDGGAVYLENGKVTISGGTIQNCSARQGGAIYIKGRQGGASNASFEMTGGWIKNNESSSDGGAIYIIDGTATLSGGTIYDNLAAGGNGGGIFVQRGSLTVDGATIQNNSSEIRRNEDGNSYVGGNGGGIYVFSKLENVDVNLISGTITDNTADRKGGGVCVDMQNSSNIANVTIGTVGGSDEGAGSIRIMYNHSLQQGGGLYARGAYAHITINSGTIMENTVSQYVYNQNVANEKGSVTLNGGNVTHNEVKFYANYGADSAPVHIQNIVTSTNSTLVAPVLSRQGYRLVGWNTKPSGKGENYSDGQQMNINENITLYAQWAIDV